MPNTLEEATSLVPTVPGRAVAWYTLAAVVLIEAAWCLDYHAGRWDSIAANGPATEAGEGLVIQWNGLGYYAWLRSPLIDGDWSFDNEFDKHNPLDHYVPPPSYWTPIGRRANQWSVGPACLWAPVVVPGHFVLKAWADHGSPWPADGYSLPYQVLVGVASFLTAVAGLMFLYGICRQFAQPIYAAQAAAWMTLGTSLFYYNAVEVTQPHGLGFAVMACLVWYWLSSYGSARPCRWFLVGALVGLAALVRWQLATYAMLPAAEAFIDWTRRRRISFVGPALAASGVVLAFSPQLIAWRCVYGSWLVSPIQEIRHHWLTPSILELFFSKDRGLFYWTPLTLIAFTGVTIGLTRARASEIPGQTRERLALMLVAFAVQVYVLGAIWGKGKLLPHTGNYGGIFLARSFGFRDLTESLTVLAPGLALLLERSSRWWLRLLNALYLVLATWNLLLIASYSKELLPQTRGASITALGTAVWQLAAVAPGTFGLALSGPLFVGLVVVVANRREPAAEL